MLASFLSPAATSLALAVESTAVEDSAAEAADEAASGAADEGEADSSEVPAEESDDEALDAALDDADESHVMAPSLHIVPAVRMRSCSRQHTLPAEDCNTALVTGTHRRPLPCRYSCRRRRAQRCSPSST